MLTGVDEFSAATQRERAATVDCQRLVLASSLAELSDLDPQEPGLAVFHTDWLSAVSWQEQGGLAFHYEAFLLNWPEELGAQDDFQQRATRWMYRDGRDVTQFLDVSLGKQFNWEAAGIRLAAGRMLAVLNRALDLLRPTAVEFRGLRTEYDFVDSHSLFALARDAANRLGLVIVDARRETQAPRLDPELPFQGEFPPQPWLRSLGLRAAELTIDVLSRLSGLMTPRSAARVFIIHNLLVVKSLIEHLPVGSAAPVLAARMHPKRPSFLLDAWKKGVRLVALPSVRLSATDRDNLQALRAAIESLPIFSSQDTLDRAVAHYLRDHVLKPGVIENKALEVLQYRKLFARERPQRILVGDSENHLVRLASEIAQSLGIGVDELPNGMFLAAQRMDNRSGDGLRRPVIDRLLAWGDANLRWADKSRVAVPTVKTGYPVADNLAKTPAPPASGQGRALILPLHVDKTDLTGLYGEVFVNMVRMAKAAGDAGYSQLRIKVHPGFIHLDYYREVARRFSLDAEVIKDGPLLPHIIWSDVVIGPVNSGAMIETAALGRPYLSVLNPPTAIDTELAEPARPVMPSMLAERLRSRGFENAAAILSGIAGREEGQDAGRRVWRALLAPQSAVGATPPAIDSQAA